MRIKICMLLSLLFMLGNTAKSQGKDSLTNVVYGKANNWLNNSQTLLMDIFFPVRQAGKKYPLVLMMHGGSFLTGSKEAMRGHCKILADSGFIGVAINYRKGWDRGTNPLACDANITQFLAAGYRAFQDAHNALQFLVSRQQEYAIDTAWIFAGGSSAGGVIALNLAYLNQARADVLMPAASKQLGPLESVGAGNNKLPKIKGLCNMWGALSDSTLIRADNAVPTIFYHGTADLTVPIDKGRFGSICPDYPAVYGSACLYRQTTAAGKAAVLNVSTGGMHGPKEFYSKITMSNTACFFKRVINGTAIGSQIFTNAKAGCR